MMVVFYHFTHHTDYHGNLFPDGFWLKDLGAFGPSGVFIFFVISGFVIPLAMMENDYHPRDFFRFLWRRMVRLEPPYIATIGLLLLSGWYFSFEAGVPWDFSWRQLASHFLYLVQFTGEEWYNPIFWTLAIEFQFYIFLGLALPLFLHPSVKVRFVCVLALCAAGGLPLSNALLPVYLPVFAMGIAWVLFIRKKLGAWQTLAVVTTGAIVTGMIHPISFAVASVLAVGFIALTSIDWRPLMFLGEISYSLYLTHGFAGGNFLYLFQYKSESSSWKWIVFILAIIGSVIAARIFYLVVERPARNWSRRIKRKD